MNKDDAMAELKRLKNAQDQDRERLMRGLSQKPHRPHTIYTTFDSLEAYQRYLNTRQEHDFRDVTPCTRLQPVSLEKCREITGKILGVLHNAARSMQSQPFYITARSYDFMLEGIAASLEDFFKNPEYYNVTDRAFGEIIENRPDGPMDRVNRALSDMQNGKDISESDLCVIISEGQAIEQAMKEVVSLARERLSEKLGCRTDGVAISEK